MSANQPDFAAIGVDPAGHAPFLVAERPMAVRTDLIHRIGLVLHGSLNQQALQLQRSLADVLLDEAAPGLFGVSSDLFQALLQVLPPVSDVLVQQVVLTLGDDLIDQLFERWRCGPP
jgi:hypothetical protein